MNSAFVPESRERNSLFSALPQPWADNLTGQGKGEVHARPYPLPPFPPRGLQLTDCDLGKSFETSGPLWPYLYINAMSLLKVENNSCEEVWTRGGRKSQLKESETTSGPHTEFGSITTFGLQGNMGPLMYET